MRVELRNGGHRAGRVDLINEGEEGCTLEMRKEQEFRPKI